MRYSRYPSYRDSGVEWLGDIPEDWENYRIDWINTIIRGNTGFKKDELLDSGEYVALQYGKTYKVDEVNETFKFYVNSEFYKFNQLVHYGDTILISTSETVGDLGHSCFYNRNDLGLIGGEQILLKPNSKFIFYKYQYYVSKVFSAELRKYATGLKVFRFNIDDLKEIFVSIPPLQEQKTIANYLDIATAKIDTLIAKQTRLIELLKEKRQAVISTAVTRGLDSTVPMKDSGVEWLGEIPEGWELPKVKYFAITDSGGTPTSSKRQEYYDDGIYPWIRTTDLNNGELLTTPVKITQKAIEETACNIVPNGSVLIGMYGGAGTIGKHALLRFPSTINQAVCSITPNKQVLAEFLHYTIQFYRPYWMIGAMGTRKDPNIGQDTINNRHFPIPPYSEQEDIANYLDEKTSKIDTLTAKATKAIDLLKEKRTALISAAVTGKIDVRDVS